MSEPKAIVAAFLDSFSSGDVESILEYLTEDATWWVLGNLDGMSGKIDKATLGSLLRNVKALYLDGALTITPSNMIGEGRQVSAEATSHARLCDGRVYANAYHFRFDLEGDRISSVREYSDTQHMLEIFGRQSRVCVLGDLSR